MSVRCALALAATTSLAAPVAATERYGDEILESVVVETAADGALVVTGLATSPFHTAHFFCRAGLAAREAGVQWVLWMSGRLRTTDSGYDGTYVFALGENDSVAPVPGRDNTADSAPRTVASLIRDCRAAGIATEN